MCEESSLGEIAQQYLKLKKYNNPTEDAELFLMSTQRQLMKSNFECFPYTHFLFNEK